MTYRGEALAKAALDEPIVCPVVLGRDRQLNALHDVAAEAAGGRGQTVLVAGEAGIGKSRLVSELAAHLTADGWQVVRGSCFERDRSVPYAPVAEMLRQVLGSSFQPAPADLEQLGQRAIDLARILPELAPWLPPDALTGRAEPEQDRRRLFSVVGEVLGERARRTPALLIVEDVHWADDASLDLLYSFARTLPARRALLLLTYRSDELLSIRGLRQLCDNLDRGRLARELQLSPLETEDLDGMLRAILSLDRAPRRDFLQLVSSLTEGNPFFVEELVRALIADGQLIRSGGTWSRAAPAAELRLPRTVLLAVQRQSETLGDQARQVLEVAAVVGQRFDFEFVRALVNLDETEFVANIKELIGAGLLIEVSAEQLVFRHALTRQAVLSQLLARERQVLHRRVAEAIEQTYAANREAHLADLAEHYHAAGLWTEAVETARRGGQHALRLYAPGAAEEQFTRALEAAEKLGNGADPDLLQMRGRAREGLGDFDGALADYTRALAGARSPTRRCEALIDLGALWASRDYARAGEWFEQALAEARRTDGDARLLARALNRFGNWLVNTGRTAEGLGLHRQALAFLEPLDDVEGIAQSLDLLGMGLGLHGDTVGAIEQFGHALERFRQLGDIHGQSASLASYAAFGSPQPETSTFVLRSLDDTRRDGYEAVRLAQLAGSLSAQAYAHMLLAQALNGFGELGEPLEHGLAAQRMAIELEHDQWQTGALCVLGETYVTALAPEAAIEALEDALRRARQLRSAWWISFSASYLALAYVLASNRARARSTLRAAWPREHTPTNGAERRVAWVWGELALADRDAHVALEIAESLLDSVPGGTRGQGIPWLHKLLGEAQLVLGRPADARASLDLAKAGALERQHRPALWQINRALARLHLSQHSAEAAYAEIEQATVCIEDLACGLPTGELASQFKQRALMSLPGVPTSVARRVEMRQAGGLSSREREVAEQVALGRSNREIAETLIIGERTVETHVTNIRSKLGLNSRRQIAAWVDDQHTA